MDDEAALLEIGKLFLEQGGQFRVDTIGSATDALHLLETKTFDAIIADYQMPGVNGIDFLRTVRASGNTIPFILLTGRGREEVAIQALNEGADFYLQKGGEPISQFAELEHQIRLAVNQRRAEATIRDHERRVADIINFLPDPTFAIDQGGTVIAWNWAMEKMTGVKSSAILGKGQYAYALPFYQERRPDPHRPRPGPGRGVREGEVLLYHPRQHHADCRDHHRKARTGPMSTSGARPAAFSTRTGTFPAPSNPSGISPTGRISRRRSGRRMSSSRQIIDLVPHMIFVKDQDGRYLLANRAVAEG